MKDINQLGTSRLSIDRETVQALSDLSPVRSMAAIAGEWTIIASAIALHLYFPHPLVYLLAWVLIGTRIYALYSLLHDGIHYLLLPGRRANDLVCKWLLAWPLFINLAAMRQAHLAHHRHLLTPNDPEQAHLRYSEFQFPRPARDLVLTFIMDLLGINFIRYKSARLMKLLSSKGNLKDNKYPVPQLIFYGMIISFILYMGWGGAFFLYWTIPYITIYQALNRLRLSTEHFHLDERSAYHTRTMNLTLLERFFLSPHNLGFHTEHHIYPSVPFYRLQIVHRALMDNEEYRKHAIIDRSYTEVIKKYIN